MGAMRFHPLETSLESGRSALLLSDFVTNHFWARGLFQCLFVPLAFLLQPAPPSCSNVSQAHSKRHKESLDGAKIQIPSINRFPFQFRSFTLFLQAAASSASFNHRLDEMRHVRSSIFRIPKVALTSNSQTSSFFLSFLCSTHIHALDNTSQSSWSGFDESKGSDEKLDPTPLNLQTYHVATAKLPKRLAP